MEPVYFDNGGGRDADARPGVAPQPVMGVGTRMTVDGEEFIVCDDGRGGTSYTWVSGPNLGYGFGVGPSAGFNEADPTATIRAFLHEIDTATGYLAAAHQ